MEAARALAEVVRASVKVARARVGEATGLVEGVRVEVWREAELTAALMEVEVVAAVPGDPPAALPVPAKVVAAWAAARVVVAKEVAVRVLAVVATGRAGVARG